MPPATVTCKICNSLVSKRSTIELKQGERVCRSHQEAVEKKQTEMQTLLSKQAVDGLSVIMYGSSIRVLAYQHGISNELCYTMLESRIPEHLRATVLKEVQARGPMTAEEAATSLAAMIGGLNDHHSQ